MYQTLLQLDRDIARTTLGARGIWAISHRVAKDISRSTGMGQKEAKDAFHGVLLVGGLTALGVAIGKPLAR